ncbi:MAG: filamentous hemagglutinin N-terminal domain-containing protein, partial [Nitrospiraceae bacterium]|nr:filamentous hemagglutinin N-terminal domain-containing protein [Nitrospiraceae bacterium]
MNADRTFLEKIKTSAVAKAMALFLSALLPLSTLPEVALALPHGGVVTKGTATLSYATNRLLVNQGTSSASFSWISFNVGSNQTVQYKTPGASSVSMNFIGGPTPAQIAGKVISNGQLVFMDPDGIVFGSGSSVSAAGIRAYGASTSSGTITPTGAISNAGTLTAGTNGPIVLVGTQVSNTGTILAPSGEVVLAAGKTVTVSESPSSSLSVATTGGGAVSDSGVIEAENVDGTPGAITLQSGMNSGTTTLAGAAVLDAGAPTGGNGG